MNSRGIPAHLLTASVDVLTESLAPGSMGEPVIRLTHLVTVPCRADHRANRRESGDIHTTPAEYKVYMSGGLNLTAANWLKLTLPDGRVVVGQVTAHKNPASAGHHTETTIACREQPPEIV